MSSDFYTSVHFHRGKILLRGSRNGERIQTKLPCKPYLFVPTSNQTKYTNVFGAPVERIDFENSTDAREFLNRYKDVHGYEIFGMTQWVYPFIYDNYASEGSIQYVKDDIRIVFVDIETDTGKYDDHLEIRVRKTERHEEIVTTVEQLYKWDGYQVFDIKHNRWVDVRISSYILDIDYGDVREAPKEINAITINFNHHHYVLGLYPWTSEESDVTYIHCKDEIELLNKFINLMAKIDPDIVTGWNSNGYDIPYITNRCLRILGEARTNALSPWGIIEKRVFVNDKGREEEHASWIGIATVDFMETYKKFEDATEESYKLEYIASKVLGVGKIDYSEYGSLRALYILNRPLYYHYNVVDVRRLVQIEDKLKLFDVQLSLAYYMGVNYSDVFGTVKPWDAFIHNFLMRQNKVVPISKTGEEGESIAGGFVKQPEPRMYRWVTSFDVKSLYPSLARQCNISPETIITTLPGVTPDTIISRKIDERIIKRIVEENVSLCGTGCIFDKSEEGFIAACMRLTYEERVHYQGEHKKFKKELESLAKDDPRRKELESQVAYYRAQQQSRKIAINALYGAMANRFFRWYDPRLSESITLTGQTTIRTVAGYVNKFLNMYCGTTDVEYVVYIDTDSNYIELNNVVIKNGWESLPNKEIAAKIDEFCKTKLQVVINKAFDDLYTYLNHRVRVLEMARENIGSRAIWAEAKKRYAMMVYDSEGIIYDPPKAKIQGHEAVKNSTPRAARDILREAIILMLTDTEDSLQKFIIQKEEEFNGLTFEEVSANKNCNNLLKYTDRTTIFTKGCPINVRAALVHNHMLKTYGMDNKYPLIQDGDKVKITYLIMPNPANSNVIAAPYDLPADLKLEDYIDYRTQFEKFVVNPLRTLTDAAGWSIEKVSSLEDLFEY